VLKFHIYSSSISSICYSGIAAQSIGNCRTLKEMQAPSEVKASKCLEIQPIRSFSVQRSWHWAKLGRANFFITRKKFFPVNERDLRNRRIPIPQKTGDSSPMISRNRYLICATTDVRPRDIHIRHGLLAPGDYIIRKNAKMRGIVCCYAIAGYQRIS
jgi:hypothetical protein